MLTIEKSYKALTNKLESKGFEIVEGRSPMIISLDNKLYYLWEKRGYWKPKGKGTGHNEYSCQSVDDLFDQITTGEYGEVRYPPTPRNISQGLAEPNIHKSNSFHNLKEENIQLRKALKSVSFLLKQYGEDPKDLYTKFGLTP